MTYKKIKLTMTKKRTTYFWSYRSCTLLYGKKKLFDGITQLYLVSVARQTDVPQAFLLDNRP